MEIIYQDKAIVVVNKPGGMLSVPGRGEDKIDSVAHRIRTSIPDCIVQPAVHRLDMDTSGLMVLALTKEAHRDLSIKFQERKTSKEYEALLEGIVEGSSGEITLPFRLDLENRPLQIYDDVHGKIGVTQWEKIQIENHRTRIRFIPLTGRTHQLRLHASHSKGLGIPIVGDPFYGHGNGPGEMKLHATKLGFTHPESGTQMGFESPAPF